MSAMRRSQISRARSGVSSSFLVRCRQRSKRSARRRLRCLQRACLSPQPFGALPRLQCLLLDRQPLLPPLLLLQWALQLLVRLPLLRLAPALRLPPKPA